MPKYELQVHTSAWFLFESSCTGFLIKLLNNLKITTHYLSSRNEPDSRSLTGFGSGFEQWRLTRFLSAGSKPNSWTDDFEHCTLTMILEHWQTVCQDWFLIYYNIALTSYSQQNIKDNPPTAVFTCLGLKYQLIILRWYPGCSLRNGGTVINT